MMSNDQIQGFVDGQMEAEVTWAEQNELLKVNHGVFVSDHRDGAVSIQGWALYHENRTYIVVDVWLPKKELETAKPGTKYEIGQGENARVGAYFGSTKIPHPGYAKSGRLQITEWQPASGLFKADFEFDVDTERTEVKVKGSVVVTDLNAR